MSRILMSPDDLSNEFFPKFSMKWLYQRLKSGSIPGAFKEGGSWLIHREKFLEGIEAKASRPTTKKEAISSGSNRHDL